MSRNLSFALLAICVAAFAFGVMELFKLRFETGDVYPPYSSLRSDPLGASAYYESLEQLPGITVERDFRMSDTLPPGHDLAYLHLAGQSYEWKELPAEDFAEMESFMNGGGRLVVAFFPETSTFFASPLEQARRKQAREKESTDQKDSEKGNQKKRAKKKMSRDMSDSEHLISITNRWGVDFAFKNLTSSAGESYDALKVRNRLEPSLPETISWHSGIVFTNVGQTWRTIYARGSDPVLIERRFGKGSLVLATDSYFVSNEALRKERHADLLAWLVGPCRKVVFDEAHLGVVEQPGVATLIRRYRLHGLVAGLLLLAGLFIWKNSASLAPRHQSEDAGDFVAGKESSAGFVNLLRRHVAGDQLLGLCFAEWKKSFVKAGYPPAKLARVQAIIDGENSLAPGDRNAVRAYQSICQALKQNSGVQTPVSPSTSSAQKPKEAHE
jgi:hypothetical protein